MKMQLGKFSQLAAFALATLSATPAAAEDPKEACVASYGESQRLRRDGKLSGAREQLKTCARDVCPSFIQTDCVVWLDEVIRVTPTVVPVARKGGRDVIDVTVWIDGKVRSTKLDGKPIEMDPGEHKFRFEHRTDLPVEETFIIREGEKNRLVSAVFGRETAPDSPPSPPVTLGPRPVPTSVYVLGGAALLAAGSGALFTALGASEKSSLKTGPDACAPFCSDSEVSNVQTKFLIAEISIGLSVVALGTAAVLYFTRPQVQPESRAVGLSAAPLSRGGVMAQWAANF